MDIINSYISLSDLQNIIKSRIGRLEYWIRAEIESHRVVNGHHYIELIEKASDGSISAKASSRIWRSGAYILDEFKSRTGKGLDMGMDVVVKVVTDYHPQYGLTLLITDIDPNYTIGKRELERKETIKKLTESGLIDKQKSVQLPFLPSSIAIISSRDAAGFGDFIKHIEGNRYGFKYNFTLFQALMQGDNAPSSIISSLKAIKDAGGFNLVLILRGGGADSDLFCYDDYDLCKSIASFPIPVFTAIGHERDYHIADMVANNYFKTPTALADKMIEWTTIVEEELAEITKDIYSELASKIQTLENETDRTMATIRFALTTIVNGWEHNLNLLEANIKAADPREILSQGYVLAVDKNGIILKNVRDKSEGDDFFVRFRDGLWDCTIDKIKIN